MIDGLDFPTEAEFRLFLNLNDPVRPLAKDWGWFGCPIWQFLKDHGLDPTIYRDGTWSPHREVEYIDGFKLAPWAAEFVWLSDQIRPRSMTFGACLELLDNPLFRPEYWLTGKVRHPIRSLKD